MRVTVIKEDDNREILCDDVKVEDGMLHIFRDGLIIEMWNMKKIDGVICDNDYPEVSLEDSSESGFKREVVDCVSDYYMENIEEGKCVYPSVQSMTNQKPM